jgi:hypothetical protein
MQLAGPIKIMPKVHIVIPSRSLVSDFMRGTTQSPSTMNIALTTSR